jgi:hypothetical protein
MSRQSWPYFPRACSEFVFQFVVGFVFVGERPTARKALAVATPTARASGRCGAHCELAGARSNDIDAQAVRHAVGLD